MWLGAQPSDVDFGMTAMSPSVNPGDTWLSTTAEPESGPKQLVTPRYRTYGRRRREGTPCIDTPLYRVPKTAVDLQVPSQIPTGDAPH